MKISKIEIDGPLIIEPEVFGDRRGFFLESFRSKTLLENGVKYDFVQDNHSRSEKNVLRGLHFQHKNPQGKLVRCTRGTVFDVIVDIRKQSKTFGEFFSIELSEENKKILWVPPGFAHGFCVTSEIADFQYKCTNYYNPNDEGGLIWNDPQLNIPWPISSPILSKKDSSFKGLSNL